MGKSKSSFSEPKTSSKRNILRRIKSLWDSAVIFSNHKGKKAEKEGFEDNLDRLFDILKCQCSIVSCQENNCDGCLNGAHIVCHCPKMLKYQLKSCNLLDCNGRKLEAKA